VLIVIMRGAWLLGLAVLIAIMMHVALTSDLLPQPNDQRMGSWRRQVGLRDSG
jgi:hypothetical protein